MKKITLFLFILFSAYGIQAQVNAESILNDFLIPSAGGVFRGYDFTTYEDVIDSMENTRQFIEFEFEDIDDDFNYTVGYNLYFKNSDVNYAYIDYTVDLIGLYEVIATIYLESDQAAIDVFNEFNKYYTKLLGVGTLQSDGWTKFDGKLEDDPFSIWIYLDEDETGKYFLYELAYTGS